MTPQQKDQEPEAQPDASARSPQEVAAEILRDLDAAQVAAFARELLPAPEPHEMPTTVVEALARVMLEMEGVGRDEKSEQGYNYRGIEGVTAAAQRLLGKYGVVFSPRVVSREVKDMTINSRPWTEDQAEIIYTVRGPSHGKIRTMRVGIYDPQTGICTGAVELDEMIDDSFEVGPLWALGRDNSDKGMNKCMTQAFKYALLQTLCIGDSASDTDREKAAERDEVPVTLTPEQEADAARRRVRAAFGDLVRSLPVEGRDAVRAYCDSKGIPRVPAQFTDEQLDELQEFVDHLPADQQPSGGALDASDDGDAAKGTGGGLDLSGLPESTSGDDDLRWMVRAPEGVPERVGALVRGLADADLGNALDVLGLSKAGKVDQKRARIAARMVRVEMEVLGGRRAREDVPVLTAPAQKPASEATGGQESVEAPGSAPSADEAPQGDTEG